MHLIGMMGFFMFCTPSSTSSDIEESNSSFLFCSFVIFTGYSGGCRHASFPFNYCCELVLFIS